MLKQLLVVARYVFMCSQTVEHRVHCTMASNVYKIIELFSSYIPTRMHNINFADISGCEGF